MAARLLAIDAERRQPPRRLRKTPCPLTNPNRP